MGSVGIPKPWVPYMNTKDCSQGFCSMYCPQWCYIIFPPPPPVEFSDDSSGPTFSPLVIAIIGILASAFLLVSYYAIISKYCGNMDSAARRENHDPNGELEESDDPSNHEPWQIASTGLDEALIKSITVCKYKKEDGLVEGSDCSVCLSEFEEDESLRLLPKCSHAFHVTCIDTWLKSHSSCPLCRANIIFINASPLPLPPVIEEAPPNNESLPDGHFDNYSNENSGVAEDAEVGAGEEEIFRALSDSGNLEGRDTIIEIRDEDNQRIRRSVSMDYSFQTRVSIADVLRMNQDHDFQIEECQFQGGVGSSKRAAVEMSKSRDRNRVLHNRSFSSGRFSFSRRGRELNPMIPL